MVGTKNIVMSIFCCFFHSYLRNVQRKSAIPTQGATFEAKNDLGNNKNNAIGRAIKRVQHFFHIQKVCLFQQPNWVREIRGPNNNYYKETIITSFLGRSVTSRTPLTLATGLSGSLDFFNKRINTLSKNSRPVPLSYHLLAFVQYQYGVWPNLTFRLN